MHHIPLKTKPAAKMEKFDNYVWIPTLSDSPCLMMEMTLEMREAVEIWI